MIAGEGRPEVDGGGIPDPLMHYRLTMAEPFGRWQQVGDYAIWAGHVRAQQPPLVLLEFVAGRVRPFQASPDRASLHRIAAGTPCHVEHLFGYWLVTDSDVVWLEAPYEDAIYYTLIVGGFRRRPEQVRCVWFCPRCGERLTEFALDASVNGFNGFLQAQLEFVRRFNGPAEYRTCRACATVHTQAYGFYPDQDTTQERLARERW